MEQNREYRNKSLYLEPTDILYKGINYTHQRMKNRFTKWCWEILGIYKQKKENRFQYFIVYKN